MLVNSERLCEESVKGIPSMSSSIPENMSGGGHRGDLPPVHRDQT